MADRCRSALAGFEVNGAMQAGAARRHTASGLGDCSLDFGVDGSESILDVGCQIG
jgi:hypothetical protein